MYGYRISFLKLWYVHVKLDTQQLMDEITSYNFEIWPIFSITLPTKTLYEEAI